MCIRDRDRTQAVLEEAGLRSADQVLNDVNPQIGIADKLEASRRIQSAHHGSTMAAGNGSSRGSFGTKIGNVYANGMLSRVVGLALNIGHILRIKDTAQNTIQSVTKVKGHAPKNAAILDTRPTTKSFFDRGL